MLWFGFLYSPAYPLGTRLGITVFWHPAVIQDFFLPHLTRRGLIISQWLLLWFYTQRIYLASLDIINVTAKNDALFVSLAYLGVPRTIWRKKKRKYIRRRRRVTARRLQRAQRLSIRPTTQLVFTRLRFLPRATGKISPLDLTWNYSGLLREKGPVYSKKNYSGLRKFGNYLLRYTQKLNHLHMDLLKRFLTGFYNNLTIREYRKYLGPKRAIKRKRWVFRKNVSRSFIIMLRSAFSLSWYRQMWLVKFLTKRRKFVGRFMFRRFSRKSSTSRTRLSHLRFFWYIKLCFETYFKQRVALSCTNLYLSYFQSGVISRLGLRDITALNRYITGIKQRRSTSVSKFRRLARDLSFRAGKPTTINKFSYTQIVLFLGLHPGWRKLQNVYNLCFLVIGCALLKNVQMVSQWLYNMVSLGHTRRFRLMRMRFFMLVAKLLRDYAVFGQYLQGFRIEVYGKTGRSQKTRTRFFGDNAGLRFYRLSFRMNYQAFDIPTFAGSLGVRFWIY
jgi:hypothetical protein